MLWWLGDSQELPKRYGGKVFFWQAGGGKQAERWGAVRGYAVQKIENFLCELVSRGVGGREGGGGDLGGEPELGGRGGPVPTGLEKGAE